VWSNEDTIIESMLNLFIGGATIEELGKEMVTPWLIVLFLPQAKETTPLFGLKEFTFFLPSSFFLFWFMIRSV
jgi:hypothetical protein